jgi:hypothetical protein
MMRIRSHSICELTKNYFGGRSFKTWWQMRLVHCRIICFMLELHLRPQALNSFDGSRPTELYDVRIWHQCNNTVV